MQGITITLDQLESLLRQQKDIVLERLADQSGYYNSKTDDGNYIPLTINKDKMQEVANKAPFPNDYNTLRKYVR